MDRDTSPAAVARYVELLRRLGPQRRLRTATSLTRATRELAEAGKRQHAPDATDAQVRRALVALLYGEHAALRLFGPADEELLTNATREAESSSSS